jgi:hypothetical protein
LERFDSWGFHEIAFGLQARNAARALENDRTQSEQGTTSSPQGPLSTNRHLGYSETSQFPRAPGASSACRARPGSTPHARSFQSFFWIFSQETRGKGLGQIPRRPVLLCPWDGLATWRASREWRANSVPSLSQAKESDKRQPLREAGQGVPTLQRQLGSWEMTQLPCLKFLPIPKENQIGGGRRAQGGARPKPRPGPIPGNQAIWLGKWSGIESCGHRPTPRGPEGFEKPTCFFWS